MSVVLRRPLATALVAIVAVMAAPNLVAAQQAGPEGRIIETLAIFVGPDGSKQPQDLGINASMGLRISGSIGVPISRRSGLGVQFGIGQNVSDAAVHVLDQISSTSSRTQTFLTAALFQRTARVAWAIGYDVLSQQYFDDVTLGQVRGRLGVDIRTSDQIGVDVRVGVAGADATAPGAVPIRLDPIAQVTGFHRHTWANGAQTSIRGGLASGHDNVVLPFGADGRSSPVGVYGAEIFVPLSERFALHGASNLVLPAATGTVDAYLGVVWFPGRGAMKTTTHRLSPVLTVANNPEFAVNLKLQ